MRPGRVGARRPVPALFLRAGAPLNGFSTTRLHRDVGLRRPGRPGGLGLRALLASLGAGCVACATGSTPHGELDDVWAAYRELAPERALAIAGELRQSRWVAGAAGGAASRDEAEARALRECRRRRAERRFQDPCRIYAVGDEIVWSGVSPRRP